MKKRVLTSIVIILVLIPLLVFSKYIVYPLALSVLAAVATLELMKAIGLKDKISITVPSTVLAVVLPIFAYFLGAENTGVFFTVCAVLYIILLFYFFTLAVFARGKMKFSDMCEAYVLVFYVTLAFSAMSLIRYIPNGAYFFGLVFLGPWACDTFAYIFGSLFGKHKLIEEISPKKTVEGSIAGVVFSTAAFLLYGLIVDLAFAAVAPNYIMLAISGFVLSIVSQIGDLIASLVKREHGIKDYGRLFPGHGGVMDRFDSILAVSIPFLLICLAFPPFV